jgi:DNA-binding PadR family transcriptional regulator
MPGHEDTMTPEQKILATLSDKMGGMSSAEIGKASGLWSASLYPALSRLEREGKVISEWEEGDYPRRRIYRL